MDRSIEQIANSISFSDIIGQKTEYKEDNPDISKYQLNPTDFAPLDDFEKETIEAEEIEIEERVQPAQKVYDAKANARALVNTICSIDSMVLSPIVVLKCRSKAGGSKAIKSMQVAVEKEFSGVALTDNDKRLIGKFSKYKKDMDYLSGEIYMSDEDREFLTTVGEDYCRKSEIEISSAGAFWANYAGSLVRKITKIIVS
jgi:hypothetical protein